MKQILTIHFEPPKRGQPLYKGQDVWSVVPRCPLYGVSIVISTNVQNTVTHVQQLI